MPTIKQIILKTLQWFGGPVLPSPVNDCLLQAVNNDRYRLATPRDRRYLERKVRAWNVDVPVVPAAVTFPRTNFEVASIVACARENSLRVQAKGGGHSFANHGLGGEDGAIVVDLKHFQQFSINSTSWQATIGAGMLLGDVTKNLHDLGSRSMSHGTCPDVGIGGHATIGGLGPTSRMYGTAMDHVEEVTAVLADSSIVTASAIQLPDLFFALKGAASSFAIITEFKVRTEPAPESMVKYAYSFTTGRYATMAQTFKDWQRLVSDPKLSWKFASEMIITNAGLILSGTYFGSREEYEALEIHKRFFHHNDRHVKQWHDWLGWVAHLGEELALSLNAGKATSMFCKSLAIRQDALIPEDVVDQLFQYFDSARPKNPWWFVYFDLEGGFVNSIPMHATAYSHRDALFYMQAYIVDRKLNRIGNADKSFIRGIADTIKQGMPNETFGVYTGYVDPELREGEAQRAYWGGNLERLEAIKTKYDPDDIFRHPQSVRPAPVRLDL